MAGGIGSRFWPMSRTKHPKQFLDILGTGKTLLQQTYNRMLPICPKENFLIVTNDAYKELVLEQLPDLKESQVLCEPYRRNTAPCVAYANHVIASKCEDANIIVAPADHLILDEPEFIKTIKTSIVQVESKDCLVTLGIKPSRPDTGYGYIQFNDTKEGVASNVKKVKTFTEKPNHDMAVKFIEMGEFFWNSGIFIWSLKSINNAFNKHLPEINHLFEGGAKVYGTSKEKSFVKKTYEICTNISLDYGIMEKSDNVYVVLSDFGWSDLGTWGSLYSHIDKDKAKNAVVGNNVMLYDSSNCIVNVPKEKLVVLQGLDDYICVDANNILLVCKKQDEQKIKQIVNEIKVSKGEQFA